MEQSRIQSPSSHKNESHHTLTPFLSQMINTSELTEQKGNKCKIVVVMLLPKTNLIKGHISKSPAFDIIIGGHSKSRVI